MAKLGELVGELQLNVKNFKASLYGAKQDIDVFSKDFNRAALISSVAIAGMSLALDDFATSAGKAEALAGGFARNFAGDMQANLSRLRNASKGTISDMQLMQTANKAALLGVTNNVDLLSAAFTTARLRGKEMGLGTADAVDSLVTGIGRASPLILDNIGIFIPEALKKMQGQVDQTTYKQLLLSAVLKDGQNIYQSYGKDSLTAADRSEQLKATLANMKNSIGTGLIPVFSALVQIVRPIVIAFSALAQSNPKVIENFAKLVVTVVAMVGAFSVANKAALGFVSVLNLIKTGAIATQLALGILGIALVALGYLAARSYASFSELGDGVNDLSDPFSNLEDYFKGAGNAMDGFADKSKQRVADIKKAIAEEVASYRQQLTDIVRTKKQELKTAREALKSEQEEFKKTQEQMSQDYDKKVADQKSKNDEALSNLEKSMKRSVVVGSSTYDKDLANYELLVEQKKAEGKKLLDEITKQYKEDTKTALEEHQTKTNELQATIDADTALLKKHANDIKGLNLKAQADEIDILKQTHIKRMKELNKQLSDEKTARNGANAQTLKGFNEMINQMNGKKVDWSKVGNVPDFKKWMSDMGSRLMDFGLGVLAMFGAAGQAIKALIFTPTKDFQREMNKAGDLANAGKALIGHAFRAQGDANFKGGRVTVGERGPEEIILPKGSQIIPNNQTQSNVTNQFTFNQVIDKSIDVDAFNHRQAFILSGLIG